MMSDHHFPDALLQIPEYGPSPTLSSYVLGPMDS